MDAFYMWGSLIGVMTNVLDYDILWDFENQPYYYVHFQDNTIGKKCQPPYISQLLVK